MKYAMNDTGRSFFIKQMSIQKKGIWLFPLAVLFLGTMAYMRGGRQIPLYVVPIPLLILINAFILLPLAGARSCRKTIAEYEILTGGKIRFTCYRPLWSAARVYEVEMEHLQWTSNAAIGKKNIYKIDPTIRITDTQTQQLFYYFPGYFGDDSYLIKQIKQAGSQS